MQAGGARAARRSSTATSRCPTAPAWASSSTWTSSAELPQQRRPLRPVPAGLALPRDQVDGGADRLAGRASSWSTSRSPRPGRARRWCGSPTRGICGSDRELLRGRPARPSSSATRSCPGHEWSGVVEAVGAGVDPRLVGRKVVGEGFRNCQACDACRAGPDDPVHGGVRGDGLHPARRVERLPAAARPAAARAAGGRGPARGRAAGAGRRASPRRACWRRSSPASGSRWWAAGRSGCSRRSCCGRPRRASWWSSRAGPSARRWRSGWAPTGWSRPTRCAPASTSSSRRPGRRAPRSSRSTSRAAAGGWC